MSLCSYLVVPKAGRGAQVAARLVSLGGCSVERAHNRELLILLTETAGADEEAGLRRSLEEIEGVQAIVLTFGELNEQSALAADSLRP